MDFMSDALFYGKQFRILTIVDNFNRKCHATFVGQSNKGPDVVSILSQIKVQGGNIPQRVQVDNGTECI